MHRRLSLVPLLALTLTAAACGDDGGGGDGNTAADASNDSIDAAGGGPADAAPPPADSAPFPLPDATPAALACAGDPLPTTVASPPIVISGEVQEGSTSGIVTLDQSAHVAAHLRADDTILVEGDFTGAFTLTDPDSSTTPIDAYLKATSNGFVDTYLYPPTPLSESQANTPIIMVSDTIFGLLPVLTGITQDAGNGSIIAAALDCDQNPIEGATITISPDVGTRRYAGANGIPGMTDYPATQASGVAYFFNVPPGEYTISASVSGTDLRDNVVKSFADASTTIGLAP